MMPVYRLPPLNALRAFEAAARHLSFAKASEELNVTPAAVSQQIKKLEEHLQVQLFGRKNRGLTLSEDAIAVVSQEQEAARGPAAHHIHVAVGVEIHA